jgi:hypothetical protein
LHFKIAFAVNGGKNPTYKSVSVRISSVIDIVPYEARICFMSFLGNEAVFGLVGGVTLPSRYMRYNAIPGSDLSTATKEEVAEMRANETALTTGWLYGRKPIEYAPEKLVNATFFFEGEDKLTTDCLVHAVNYALRFPFFVQREQVMRLVGLRGKVNSSLASKYKCNAGVPPSSFVDFAVVAGSSLSLHLLETFSVENGQGSNTLKAFVLSKMLDVREFSELVVVGHAMGVVVPYSHACSFVAIDQDRKRHLAYCDC